MTIFVYTEAYKPIDEYMDITATKVFESLDDAVKYLQERVDAYAKHPEDGDKWTKTLELDTYCHMIHENEEEVVMAIGENKIV